MTDVREKPARSLSCSHVRSHVRLEISPKKFDLNSEHAYCFFSFVVLNIDMFEIKAKKVQPYF